MGLFTSRQDRLEGAARALAPFGFVFDAREAGRLARYAPFVALARPHSYVTAAFGAIEGHRFEIYEYDSCSQDSEGNTTYPTELAIVVHHPGIRGGAVFTPDYPQWGGAAAVIDALMWIPPFTLLKLFQFAVGAARPDREVGHADFDRLFVVRAASDAAARAAIPPRLREVAARMGRRMTVELRDGALVCCPDPSLRLDAERAPTAVAVAAALVAAFVEA